MLYLIGGSPRTGKSLLAQRIVEQIPMPWTAADVVRRALFEVAPHLNIDLSHSFPQKQTEFEPYLMSMCDSLARNWEDVLLEGDVLLPKHVARLQEEFAVRAVFLGHFEANIETMIEHQGFHTWLERVESQERSAIASRMEYFSRHLEAECKRYELPYFDISSSWPTQHDNAFAYLRNPN